MAYTQDIPQRELGGHAMNTATTTGQNASGPFTLNRARLSQPLHWLTEGWRDLCHTPLASLAYGAIVSMLGAIILGYASHPYFVVASISAFLLVGPIMTAGLCELSRRREAGEACDFGLSLQVLAENREGILRFANTLLLISLVWCLLATMLFYIGFEGAGPQLSNTLWGDIFAQIAPIQAVSYLVAGGILAGLVFALSVVTVPMLIDREASAKQAMGTSVRIALSDLTVMLLWASLIIALVGIGFATFLAGMVIVFPLLGHATWHAYRDLVA
jgi:uncharacterized membrane protein